MNVGLRVYIARHINLAGRLPFSAYEGGVSGAQVVGKKIRRFGRSRKILWKLADGRLSYRLHWNAFSVFGGEAGGWKELFLVCPFTHNTFYIIKEYVSVAHWNVTSWLLLYKRHLTLRFNSFDFHMGVVTEAHFMPCAFHL
jgi:hypothetical protein